MRGDGSIIRGSGRDGFTLIELIIVLVLIGIMTGIAGMYVGRGTGTLDLKKFTKEISSVMRYARSHAVSEKRIYCLVIDREERMLRLYSEEPDYTDVVLVMEKEFPEGLQIDLADRDRREDTFVEFFPGGNTSGGVFEVTNSDGLKFSIVVNRITGKLIVEKDEH